MYNGLFLLMFYLYLAPPPLLSPLLTTSLFSNLLIRESVSVLLYSLVYNTSFDV